MQEEMGSTSSTALHYKTSGHIIFFMMYFSELVPNVYRQNKINKKNKTKTDVIPA